MLKFVEDKLALFEELDTMERDFTAFIKKKVSEYCPGCKKNLPLVSRYWTEKAIYYIEERKSFGWKCKSCYAPKYALRNMYTPKWANLKQIKKMYDECPAGYEVDHIIPLKGKTVCGFHVENNLQYLTVKKNRKKHNKFENNS